MRSFFTARRPASASSPAPASDRGGPDQTADPAAETKAQPLVAVELGRRACFTAPDFASLCRQGYARNPVVYRCVRLIAEAAASVPLRGLDLPRAGGPVAERLEAFYGYLQVAGRAYLEALTLDGELIGLRTLRPDTVRPLTDRGGRPSGFEIETAEGRRRIAADPLTNRCALMELALFDPLGSETGQSPLRAAATSVDLHNEGTRWAKALLDNSARPSGALVFRNGHGSGLTPAQLETLKTELERGFSGPANAGRPLVLEGGLDWTSMSLSPADMDFTQGRREAARDIALAFGVPPMLLGIPGDNTYANYAEANRAFWRQTIVPLVNRTARSLAHWLEPWLGAVEVVADLDRVPALSEERAALWTRLEAASFIDDDERRAFAGLPARGTVQ